MSPRNPTRLPTEEQVKKADDERLIYWWQSISDRQVHSWIREEAHHRKLDLTKMPEGPIGMPEGPIGHE